MAGEYPMDSLEPSRLAPNDSILMDYTTKDIPTNIKELFDLIEYLCFNSGQVVSAIKKLTEFPITKPIFNTNNSSLREMHERIAEKVGYKSRALDVGFDYNMYGNSITSVYKPFVRYLKCTKPGCSCRERLIDAEFSYFPKDNLFVLRNCPGCGGSSNAIVEDLKDTEEANVNIIRWNLKYIDIEYNNFTGKRTYYYTMSEEEKRKIKDNDKDVLSSYPLQMLPLATKDNKYRFKFNSDYVYHMRTANLSGISKVWGFPQPTPALKSFFYQFMLRKANEAVALDYLNHLRVIYPAMSQAENNPLQYINMSVWAEEMTSTIRKWRLDRNFIKLSPHPLGYQTVGGEGRGLLLTSELREASYDILMTLGIPREFMEGSTVNNLASPILLRIVENMMLTYVEQLTSWLNWVDKKISDWKGIEHVHVSFLPFRFMDDLQRKSLLIQWGQGGESKKVSDTTIADHLEVDLEKEDEKIVEDEVRKYKLQKSISKKIQDLETSLAAQAEAQHAQVSGAAVDYNNQSQTLAQADQVAQQLIQVPYEQRKSHLSSLQKEDYVMYSVVVQRMEDINRQMKNSVIDAAKVASLKGEYPEGFFNKVASEMSKIEELERSISFLKQQINKDEME